MLDSVAKINTVCRAAPDKAGGSAKQAELCWHHILTLSYLFVGLIPWLTNQDPFLQRCLGPALDVIFTSPSSLVTNVATRTQEIKKWGITWPPVIWILAKSTSGVDFPYHSLQTSTSYHTMSCKWSHLTEVLSALFVDTILAALVPKVCRRPGKYHNY